MNESEVVINVTKYGEEQYNAGYRAGTWNGLVIADQLFGDIERMGMIKAAKFAELIIEMAKEHNIYPADSPYTRTLERRIRKYKKKEVPKDARTNNP